MMSPESLEILRKKVGKFWVYCVILILSWV